ncbi:terminase small subunit [Variovorax dokdonensis]|uniref:Terminase small subunit n=1 Tax=Variovorax dokdonensis TaxID=344883 RepID=A0ABT7N726_9BURK|nr:terminase small subunit [Variovorax dokdonensis]MDM0043754.1 terminase small subunit [Variovorax dokdonensis]
MPKDKGVPNPATNCKVSAAPAPPFSKWKRVNGESPARPSEAERLLTANEERFCQEYLIDLNATQAYMRARPGVKVTTSSVEGAKLLRNPQVAARITRLMAERSVKTGITAERVLQELWAIASADPRELVEHIVGCCRHCHGERFRHQRTVGEMQRDRAVWLEKGNDGAEFDEHGGIGFDPRKAPNPECPECFGRGHGRTFLGDTRKLSAAAAALYAGVKESKEGFEVKMHSKLDALEKVAKHIGLYEKHNQQKADPLGSLLAAIGRSALPVVKEPPRDD